MITTTTTTIFLGCDSIEINLVGVVFVLVVPEFVVVIPVVDPRNLPLKFG